MESKRPNKFDHETQDRISGLPDHIIHHILSFLPSTKQAIRTTLLSKRWEIQWTRVPVLIFNSTGMSFAKFLKFIDHTLIFHDCSKINKFHLRYPNIAQKDPQFTQKVLFATRKHVEDLNLSSSTQEYTLPKFLFNHASLVKLTTVNCTFMPIANVNWGCLTVLIMKKCNLSDQAMDHIVSGSPLLKSLHITECVGFQKLVIASKSLKRLVLKEFRKSSFYIEISCPILEELELARSIFSNAKLGNLPCSLCVTLDFYLDLTYAQEILTYAQEIRKSWMKNILHQLRHVKELTIGICFSAALLASECVESLITPMLNIKCLTLFSMMLYKYYCSRIPCVLHNTPHLERLIIITSQLAQTNGNLFKPNDFEENYWNSNMIVFNCLVSHLKTIEIIGFPKGDYELKLVLNFVRFLLKNARVLEKMVVKLKDDGTGFALEASQELLRLPRCSQDSIIELI